MNTEDFENLNFNTLDKESILLNNSFDPDSNFFQGLWVIRRPAPGPRPPENLKLAQPPPT